MYGHRLAEPYASMGPSSSLLIFWAKSKNVCSLQIKVENTFCEETFHFIEKSQILGQPNYSCEKLSIPEGSWEHKNPVRGGNQVSWSQA